MQLILAERSLVLSIPVWVSFSCCMTFSGDLTPQIGCKSQIKETIPSSLAWETNGLLKVTWRSRDDSEVAITPKPLFLHENKMHPWGSLPVYWEFHTYSSNYLLFIAWGMAPEHFESWRFDKFPVSLASSPNVIQGILVSSTRKYFNSGNTYTTVPKRCSTDAVVLK